MVTQKDEIIIKEALIDNSSKNRLLQYEREHKAQIKAMRKAHDRVSAQLESNKLGETKVACLMIEHALQTVFDSINDQIASAMSYKKSGRPSIHQTSWQALSNLNKASLESFVACGLSTLFDYAGSGGKYTACMFEIGQRAEHLVMMNEIREDDFNNYRMLKKRLESKSSEKKRLDDISFTHRLHCIPAHEWDKLQVLGIGACFYETAKDLTGYFEDYDEVIGNNKTIKRIKLTCAGQESIRRGISSLVKMARMYEPMVSKPIPWSADNFFHGAYLTAEQPCVRIVKNSDKNYLINLSNSVRCSDADFVFTLNSLQETGWRIRSDILDVIESMFKLEEGHGVLPALKTLELPDCPETADEARKILSRWKVNSNSTIENNDRREWISSLSESDQQIVNEFLAWKHKTKTIHKLNVETRHKWAGLCRNVSLAKELKGFESIYFPYQMDFRGRIYAVPQGLNPQGQDYVKALLEFDVGVPLEEHGWDWLLWQTANTWGHDKVSHQDRVDWSNSNLKWIKSCGNDPFNERKWMDADKPWQFLACCFEIKNALALEDPFSYKSHMPINLDGSCSGLQHIAMLTRCRTTAESVNLIYSKTPNDIYQDVADKVASMLIDIAACDNLEKRTLAQQWISWGKVWDNGKLSRKVTKRSVMTFAYGSSDYSSKVYDDILVNEYNQAAQNSIGTKLKLDEFPWAKNELRKVASFIGELIGEAVKETVIKPAQFMKWMEQVACVFNDANLPLKWKTPSGFDVYHFYPKTESKRVNWTLKGGKRLQVSFKKPVDGINAADQKKAAAPNLIHSLDAAHLCKTINTAKDHAINHFAVVHDSFGTHAANAALLFEILRNEMYHLYSDDLLSELYSDFLMQLPETHKAHLPAPVQWGEFDVAEVLGSPYVFS